MDTTNTLRSVVEQYVNSENVIITNQYYKNRVDRDYTNNDPNRDYIIDELEGPYKGLIETRKFDAHISEATKSLQHASNEILYFLRFYPILNFKHTQTVVLIQPLVSPINVTYDFIFSLDATTNELNVEKKEHV